LPEECRGRAESQIPDVPLHRPTPVEPVVRLGGGKLILQIGGRGTVSQVEFWIPTDWVIFGSPGPGTHVLVYAKVRKILSDPFIATRVQPW
jgi:hypothetical protein